MDNTATSRPGCPVHLEDFDHTSPDYAKDPEGALRGIREQCPVVHTGFQGGLWILTGYEGVATAARNDDLYSSAWDPEGIRKGASASPKPRRNGFIDMDPPDSLKYRMVVAPMFTRPAVAKFKGYIEQSAHDAIDEFIEDGQVDFVAGFAEVMAAMTTMRIVGVPTHNWRDYVHYFHESSGMPTTAPGYRERQGPNNFVVRSMRELILLRRGDPQDDAITRLATQPVDGGEPMPIDIAAECASLLLSGGLDTTAALLSNVLLYLYEQPAVKKRLIDNPELLKPACEEFIRFFTPVQNLARTVTRDHELYGAEMHEGDRVMLSWASANRDPKEFESPDEIDIERFPNRHQGFGIGTHRCIGSALARESFIIGLHTLLARMPDYTVDTSTARRYTSLGSNYGWVTMPITFPPGQRRGAGVADSSAAGT